MQSQKWLGQNAKPHTPPPPPLHPAQSEPVTHLTLHSTFTLIQFTWHFVSLLISTCNFGYFHPCLLCIVTHTICFGQIAHLQVHGLCAWGTDFNRIPSKTTYTNKQKQTNSVALSPRANYTDWATATCRRNCQLLWIEGCRVVSAADPLRSPKKNQ
jgi:hypothetical protein